MDRWIDRKIDTQIDGKTDRQTDRQIVSQIGQIGRQTNRQKATPIDRQRDGQIETKEEILIDTLGNRQKDRQTD